MAPHVTQAESEHGELLKASGKRRKVLFLFWRGSRKGGGADAGGRCRCKGAGAAPMQGAIECEFLSVCIYMETYECLQHLVASVRKHTAATTEEKHLHPLTLVCKNY